MDLILAALKRRSRVAPIFVLVVLNVYCLIGCRRPIDVHESAGVEEGIRTIPEFDLSPEQQQKLKLAAAMFDEEAGYRLGRYYELILGDRRQALYWMEVSAKLGNLRARMWIVDQLLYHSEKPDLDAIVIHVRKVRTSAVETADCPQLRWVNEMQVEIERLRSEQTPTP